MMNETYICVDVETAGPIPALYAMLSIGACLVDDVETQFYVELKPDREELTAEALAVSGLSMEMLREFGAAPKTAMQAFADWVRKVTPEGNRPVLVALNAPFDWMFINDYFHRYLGHNPFGHSALDIKAFYMGATGVTWSKTSYKYITAFLDQEKQLFHNALQDAKDQAEIFREIIKLREASQ